MTRTGIPWPNPCIILPQGIAIPTNGYVKHNVLNALTPIFLIFSSSVNRLMMLGASKYTIVEAIATITNALEIA